MRSIIYCFVALSLLAAGCGGWGDYKFKSDRFKFKAVFPMGWEVWDRSDDSGDYLVASLPDENPDAKITLKSRKVAPDISPNEIYPTFLDGSGDGSVLMEFQIEEKGTISAKNGDGRMIVISYLGEKHRMKGIRTIFLGMRYIVEITYEIPADNYLDHVSDFRKMISLLEL